MQEDKVRPALQTLDEKLGMKPQSWEWTMSGCNAGQMPHKHAAAST